MEKHHFLRYNAENQKVKPGDGSKQSITSRRYALPKQNNLFWYEKDRVNDAKRYGFTDQNNLFCFCADGMMRIKEAILMNTGGKNKKVLKDKDIIEERKGELMFVDSVYRLWFSQEY